MGKKKGISKSSDVTPLASKEEHTSATTDKKISAKKNRSYWESSGLKSFALGVIVALLGSMAFSAYQNVSSDQVKGFVHNYLDGLVGSNELDRFLGLFLSKTVVTETVTTKDDDNMGTDYVTGVDSRTSKSKEKDSNKDSMADDRMDGKHMTDDRKDGDSFHPPSPSVLKEETTTRQAKDEGDRKKTKTSKSRYPKSDITNKADNRIRNELDQADEALEKDKITEAIGLYDAIIGRYSQSPRALYGKANALNKMAELKKSNTILEEAIAEFLNVLSLPDVPKPLAIKAAKKCADRQSFRGWGGKAIKTLRQLISVYPEETELWNDLGVKCLLANRIEDARQAFRNVLEMDASNGFAKVHLGFIIKTTDKNYKDSIPYLRQGIESNAPGVIDGRFFFHLGDALYRVGQHNESYKVYQLGADKGVFRSVWQRSLYNVEGLTARPWWTKAQTGNNKFLTKLEENWETIRDEGLANLDENRGVFQLEDEDLREEGDWRQFTLYMQGRKIEENCRKAPKTCSLLEGFTEATGCKRGQIKFSVMQPGVHVWPHCGPTNCRIRAHIGLVIPEGPEIRIANDTRTWKLGKFIVFDDSFEHEVWHRGSSVRLVLIVDMWHPELTALQKGTLSPI